MVKRLGSRKNSFAPLINNIITDSKYYIDNLFADTWKKLKFSSLIKTAGFTKKKRD